MGSYWMGNLYEEEEKFTNVSFLMKKGKDQ